MLVLANGDSLRGSASVAAVVDYSFHGLAGSTIALLAEGQLPVADGELYPAAAIVVVKSVVLVNTHTAAVTINLTILKAASTARRLLPKNLSLPPGYMAVFDGSRFSVFDTSGNLLTLIGNVEGLPGLLADDQHVLDAEVLAYILSLTGTAANRKLFVNAAGTGVEWASGIKIGTFTRDMTAATGSVSYTAVGFKPSVIIFMGGINTTVIATFNGFDNATSHYSSGSYSGLAAGAAFVDAGSSIILYETNTKLQAAFVSSMDADGFTLSWSKGGIPAAGTATMFYLAFR